MPPEKPLFISNEDQTIFYRSSFYRCQSRIPRNTPQLRQSRSSSELANTRNGDELGEIAVMDKADFTLSSDGQLCCLTDLFLLFFSFTSFIFFIFYLGHRHVAGPGVGLGSLASSLSARARVYGDTRLRSLPVDSGSDRTCLTLERFTVTWEDGYGHADEYSAIFGCVSRVFQPCPGGVS